jgi:alkylated DNA repair dioxygenase AlkB
MLGGMTCPVLHDARRLPLEQGCVDYLPGFLDEREADELLRLLHEQVRWEQHHVRIYGRQVPSPRLSAWSGDAGITYAYSGMVLRAEGWTPALAELRARVEATSRRVFNSVLLNRYRSGADSMGWHADDEAELGPEPCIASVSLGATRRFRLRHRRRKDLDPVAIDLEHGSLLLMSGQTQAHWRHAVPKTKRPVGERINLTFRNITFRNILGRGRAWPGPASSSFGSPSSPASRRRPSPFPEKP